TWECVGRDWRDDRIAELEGKLALRDEQIAGLLARVAELEERLGRSSRNSSKPPSSDGPADRHKRRSKKPSGRAPGGQPGHDKHEHPEVDPEKVSKRIVLRPDRCARCAKRLVGSDPEARRHHVYELPEIEPTRIFGPSVTAVCSYLMGVHRLGKRGAAEVLHDLCALPISVGAVVDSQEEASHALAAPYDEALSHAQAAPIKNADETGWREGNGKSSAKAWLWTLVTSKVIVFMVHKSRAQDAAMRLPLGAKTALKDIVFGCLGTDRHGGYNFWPLALRQFCWSHLRRDFIAIAERSGAAGHVGRQLLEETDRMFGWWNRVRDGTLTHAQFRIYM